MVTWHLCYYYLTPCLSVRVDPGHCLCATGEASRGDGKKGVNSSTSLHGWIQGVYTSQVLGSNVDQMLLDLPTVSCGSCRSCTHQEGRDHLHQHIDKQSDILLNNYKSLKVDKRKMSMWWSCQEEADLRWPHPEKIQFICAERMKYNIKKMFGCCATKPLDRSSLICQS